MKKPIMLALRCCALLSFLFSFSLLAQTKITKQTSSAKNDIYVAYDRNNGITIQRVKYYKNDQPGIPLMDNGKNTEAFSIFMSGNDVYLPGTTMDKAVYWKNGQLIPIENSYQRSAAIDMVVVGDDVYVAGNVSEDPYWSNTQARYWKNGQEVKLQSPNRTGRAWVQSISVIDNDVYVIGREESYIPIYWKNGKLMDSFQLDRVSVIKSINGNIYAVGSQNKKAAYWKNGKITILTTEESLASGIAVSGNDVYIIGVIGSYDYKALYPGYGNGGKGVYWKNGQIMSLNGADTPYPTSVSVDGDDSYIVGVDQTQLRSILWINGEPAQTKSSEGFFESPIAVASVAARTDNNFKTTKVLGKKESLELTSSEASLITDENIINKKRNEVSAPEINKETTPVVEKVILTPEEIEANDFFAENKKRPGVITLPSGLQYEVIKQGTGPKPLASDLLEISGKRTMMFGKKITSKATGWSGLSTINENKPGLAEGLQLMSVGSIYKFYIPSKLEYGNKYSLAAILIEEIELLKNMK